MTLYTIAYVKDGVISATLCKKGSVSLMTLENAAELAQYAAANEGKLRSIVIVPVKVKMRHVKVPKVKGLAGSNVGRPDKVGKGKRSTAGGRVPVDAGLN